MTATNARAREETRGARCGGDEKCVARDVEATSRWGTTRRGIVRVDGWTARF